MIVLATPTRDMVTALFAGDLLKLCRRHPEMRFAALLGIYIANLRQSAVSIAQQVGASHLLFIDSDMRFPEDTLGSAAGGGYRHRGGQLRHAHDAGMVGRAEGRAGRLLGRTERAGTGRFRRLRRHVDPAGSVRRSAAAVVFNALERAGP
jgi:hypothetical protein